FLQLVEICLADWCAGGGELEKLFVMLNTRVDVIEAHVGATPALFEKVDRHVHSDRVNPRIKRRTPTEAIDRAVSLRPNVLHEVMCVLMIGGHVVNQSVET